MTPEGEAKFKAFNAAVEEERASIRHELGRVEAAAGKGIPRLPEALRAFVEAMMREFQSSMLKDSTIHTARVLEAEEVMRRVLEMDEPALGSSHPDVAHDLQIIAGLRLGTSLPSDGREKFARGALAIDEARPQSAERDCAVARDLRTLADLLNAARQATEAEPLARRAHRLLADVSGSEHRDTLAAGETLALSLVALKRHDEAESFFQAAMAHAEAVFGKNHPAVAVRLGDIIACMSATGREAGTEPLLLRKLAIDEVAPREYDTNGAYDRAVVQDLYMLSNLLMKLRRPMEAEPIMVRHIEKTEARYGDNWQICAGAIKRLADLLENTERSDKSLTLHRRMLVVCLGEGRALAKSQAHPFLRQALKRYRTLLARWEGAEAFPRALEALMAECGMDESLKQRVRSLPDLR